MGLFKKLFSQSSRKMENEAKSSSNNKPTDNSKDSKVDFNKKPKYHHIHFNVAGTTFKNGRETRQALLRRIKFKDDPFEKIEKVEFEPYTYENENAYYVKVNDKIIGSLPKEVIPEFEEYVKYPITVTLLEIIGGGTRNGERLNYGCEICLRFDLDE